MLNHRSIFGSQRPKPLRQSLYNGLTAFVITSLLLTGCGQLGPSATTGIPNPSESTSTESTSSGQVSEATMTPDPNAAASPDTTAATEENETSEVTNATGGKETEGEAGTSPAETPPPAYDTYRANEMGRVPVVMFHRFVESLEEVKDKNYTCSLTQFETLLQTLYDQQFRLVPMADFLSGHIRVPAGYRPVVFTFDDGTASQFSLEEKDGGHAVVPRTAVGVMLAFAETHPDFGLAGTFFLNMDVNFFSGAGSKLERLHALESLGFDIGTHTWAHADFQDKGTPDAVQEALGRNQQVLTELDPTLFFRTLALPYGSRPKDKTVRPYLAEGEWEGTAYRNDGVFAVGAGPSVMPWDDRFDPLFIPRVRATGKVPAEADLDWWLENAGAGTWYVSDGDPDTLVIPEGGDSHLLEDVAEGFQVIRYPVSLATDE